MYLYFKAEIKLLSLCFGTSLLCKPELYVHLSSYGLKDSIIPFLCLSICHIFNMDNNSAFSHYKMVPKIANKRYCNHWAVIPVYLDWATSAILYL